MPTINGKGQASIFTRVQLDKFFKIVKQDSMFYYTLFKFLYYSGERNGCSIQTLWDDIDFENNLINFRAETRKGKYSRKPLLLHMELKQVLLDYKKWKTQTYGVQTASKILHVFPGRNHLSHITRSSVDYNLKIYLLKCGFENKGFSIHSFRRTFITRLYEFNKNVKECMAITGHNSVASFMLYIEVDEDRILETMNNL